MGTLLLAVVLATTTPPQQDGRAAAAVVQHGIAAVEGDCAVRVRARWRRQLSREPADRLTVLGLATIAHYSYQDSTAERLYRDVLRQSTSDRIAVYASLGLTRLAIMRARWPRADTLGRAALEAARATRDPKLIAEAIVTFAAPRLRLGGGRAALELLADPLVSVADAQVRARERCITTQALESLGDPQGGVRAAREGIELANRARDTRARGACEFVLASAYSAAFAVDSAMAAYERAIQTLREVRDRSELSTALMWRAEYARLLGRLGQARRDGEEAAREAEAVGHWNTAGFARQSLARVAMAVGDLTRAASESRALNDIFARDEDPFVRVLAPALEASLALAQGDLARARETQEHVVREANAIGWTNGQMGPRSGLVWVALMQGDSTGARAAIESVRELAMRTNPQGHAEVMSFFEAIHAVRFGRLAEAEQILRARRAGQASRGSRRYVDGARLAEVLVRTGRIDEAERELMLATEELDAWRESLGDRQLRLLAFQQAADRADPDLGVATVIATLAQNGRIAAAFEIAERGRARDLADRLSRSVALDTASGDRVVRGVAPMRLDSLTRVIADDSTAIFTYITGRGDPTTLLVITRRQTRAYILASQDSVAPSINRFAALIESGDDPRALARSIGADVMHPALADLDSAIRRIVVVPDGPLHRLPFDALVLPDGRFAVERFAVTMAPSATVMAHIWERRRDTAPARALVLADPKFVNERVTSESAVDVFRTAAAGRGGLPRLRGTAREARAVARYAEDATVRRRTAANETWLKTEPLASYGVLHFATHALVDEGNVAGTALALAPAANDDGFVGPAELAELDLAAELVVLSACRTASGVVVRGEGVLGLAAPLLAAGARSVAATWWPIGDRSTVRLVDDFYRAMAEGMAAADALRSAKLAALERGAPAAEWAAFTLIGDPLAHPALRVPSEGRPSPWLIAPAFAVFLLAYGVARRNRRNGERTVVPSVSTARTHQR